MRGRVLSKSLSSVNAMIRSPETVLISVWRAITLAPVISPMNYPAASCGVSEQIENHLLNCHPRMSLAGVQS